MILQSNSRLYHHELWLKSRLLGTSIILARDDISDISDSDVTSANRCRVRYNPDHTSRCTLDSCWFSGTDRKPVICRSSEELLVEVLHQLIWLIPCAWMTDCWHEAQSFTRQLTLRYLPFRWTDQFSAHVCLIAPCMFNNFVLHFLQLIHRRSVSPSKK